MCRTVPCPQTAIYAQYRTKRLLPQEYVNDMTHAILQMGVCICR